MEAREDREGIPKAVRDERGHAIQGGEGDQACIRDRADGGIPRGGREIPDAAEHDEREPAGNIVSEIIAGGIAYMGYKERAPSQAGKPWALKKFKSTKL